MRRAALLVVLAACALLVLRVLPPRSRALAAPAGLPVPLRGAIHVHTDRSDGTGSVDEVAAAAARAGLDFVILTDHGDGTRPPDPARRLHGVLCIDGVEISTFGGHLVALGLPQTPYPLGGEPRDVVDDVHRLGGMAIAAHPSSAKPDLRWGDWDVPLDGIEWLNGDSEWRDEPYGRLVLGLLTYPFRRAETLGALLDMPEEALERWDALARLRPTVAVAAADAHARIGLRGAGDPYDEAVTLHLPAYEQVFRAFSIAIPALQPSDDPVRDARTIIDEIRRGHVYSTVDALAGPGVLAFSASADDGASAAGGDVLVATGNIAFRADTNAPEGAAVMLLRDGERIAAASGRTLEYSGPAERGAYRVQVTLPGSPGTPPAPWIVSNPIYVRPAAPDTPGPPHPAEIAESVDLWSGGSLPDWRIEHGVRSSGALDVVRAVGGQQLLFRYGLGGTLADSAYAAVSIPAGARAGEYDRVAFTAYADRPMRAWVQLRAPGEGGGERWGRSIYLDRNPRAVTVMFDDMRPIGPVSAPVPPRSRIDTVLIVVDTINTPLGQSGQIWLDGVRLAR